MILLNFFLYAEDPSFTVQQFLFRWSCWTSSCTRRILLPTARPSRGFRCSATSSPWSWPNIPQICSPLSKSSCGYSECASEWSLENFSGTNGYFVSIVCYLVNIVCEHCLLFREYCLWIVFTEYCVCLTHVPHIGWKKILKERIKYIIFNKYNDYCQSPQTSLNKQMAFTILRTSSNGNLQRKVLQNWIFHCLIQLHVTRHCSTDKLKNVQFSLILLYDTPHWKCRPNL